MKGAYKRMEIDPSGLSMVILFILLITYALLTAAETSARTLNRNKLRRQSEAVDIKTDRLIRFAQKLTETPSGLRACMAFVGFLSSGLALWLFALPLAGFLRKFSWLDFFSDTVLTWLAILPVMTINTLVMLVFATLLPRRLAERNAEKTARRLRGFASFFNTLFLPMARLVNWMIRKMLHAFGIDPDEEIEKLTEDEIRLLVDVGEEKGAIEETEREMIENVFEFNNLTAEDAMTHRTDVWAIWIEDSDDEITSMIEETGLSRFPVYDEDLDHIIGTVSTRDFLLNRLREKPKSLQEITRKARFVPDSVRTDVLFRDMQHNKYHMAVVVDEYGGTSGLITMEDLIEEIVGNIYDENDPQVQQDIIELGGGRYKVAGSVEIEAFNEAASLDLSVEEDYDTIGGLILSELGSIPDEGSQPEIEFEGLHLRVLSIIDRRIEWVEISPLVKEENEQIV